VPSNVICKGSFCDLKRKKIEEDMVLDWCGPLYQRGADRETVCQ